MAKRHEDGVARAVRYVDDVLAGRVVVGDLVRLAVQRHADDLARFAHQTRPRFYFDADAGRRAIEFFAMLRHSKGEWAGQVFELSGFQAFIVWSLWGWRRSSDGTRRFRTAYFELARKNGKTTFAAALALLLLVGDDEPGAEVYVAATKRDQARITHSEAVRMVRGSPDLGSEIVTFRDNLNVPKTGSKCEPLGADADTMDGLNVSGAIVDELHAHKTRDVVERLDTATGARRQPLIIFTTTAGDNQQGICWEMHERARRVLERIAPDDSLFAFIAAPDPADDWKSERTWEKANPNLDVSVKREALRRECRDAQRRPAAQNAFRRFKCNQWVRQRTRFIDLDRWDACAKYADREELANTLRGAGAYGGLDLSARTDLTAFVLAFPRSLEDSDDEAIDVLAWHWLPEDRVDVLEDETGVPLRLWADEGWIELTPGDVVDLEFVRQRIRALGDMYKIHDIAFDRFGALWIYPQLEGDGLTMVAMGQGFASMSAPTRELEAAVISRRIQHCGDPVLRWEADSLEVLTDAAGNLKPAKPDRRKANARIDGMVALIMSLDRAIRRDNQVEPSVYETRGILSL